MSQHVPPVQPQDDDDDDICPVCDGQCTCNPHPPLPVPQLRPSLKIKLTVPQALLAKRTKAPPPTPQHKRRGRPPKALSLQKKPQKKSTPAKRRRVQSSDSSDLSDVDRRYAFHHDDDDDDDAHSGHFPTFVSASVLSSRASSSDAESSELSDFDDTDSSIEAEEEKFIVSQMQGRARVRRELFGDDVPKKRDPHNAWVIRPRKKSVGPSDVEMDVDTDATEDADQEDDDDDDGDQDEEETDERGTSVGYVGLATGWTEDEDESSFDADLFFANLSDSEDHASSSVSDREGDDGDHSDMESMVASITSLPSMPPELEVQERWDGQIVFTNGLREGQGMLDVDFEAHAASFAETSPSPGPDSDVDMSDVDDGGYEEDADEGDGETTDEELVGQDDLPNERAMRLFMTPFSVSAINPMSTMSPAVSPGPRDRRSFSWSIDSPKPADILSGRVFWDSDDHDDYEELTTKSSSQVSSAGQGPRKGHFVPTKDVRQAIIDDLHNNIPSPHPRFRRRRQSFVHLKGVQDILQRHLAIQQSPIPCAPSPLHLVTPVVDKAATMSPELANAELVDLDDVLEPSILDPEPSDTQNTSADNDSRKLLRSLNRWDVISVGAFRQSRESAEGGWASESTPANKTDYGSMMKSSPLSTMLWHNKPNTSPRRSSRKMSVIISPVLLPVRDRDGDRTPTNTHMPHHHQQNQRNDNSPHKTRKELRRERKLKRKSYGPAHHNNNQRHQHHHQHQHHPNMKSRSTSSSQRNNFFSSSVPPLNI